METQRISLTIGTGQYCSLYSEAWNTTYATNVGQYRGSDLYTIQDSYSAYNKTNDGTVSCQPVCNIKDALNEGFESGSITYTTDQTVWDNPSSGAWTLIDISTSQMSTSWGTPSQVQVIDSSRIPAYSGSKSIGFTFPGPWQWMGLVRTIKVCPNTRYYYSVWVRDPNNNGNCDMSFRVDGQELGGAVGSLTNNWSQLSYYFDSGSRTTVKVGFVAYSRIATTIQFDNVQVTTDYIAPRQG
jgi:hypothetical protein